MKKFPRYILIMLAMLLAMTGIESCIMDNEEAPAYEEKDGDTVTLVFRVGSINDDAYSRPGNELINSLRIIIVSGGVVEFNQKITPTNPASSLTVEQIEVLTGPKEVYLIANADNLYLTAPGSSRPVKADDFFDGYPRSTLGFSEAIEGVYFNYDQFDYTNVDESLTPPLIPLTAKYDIVAQSIGTQEELEFWLVPAATKYTVHFSNSRAGEVYLKELSISTLQEDIYLMPHVGESQQTISGEYWVDWLRKVSEESQKPENQDYQDNLEFNQRWGWITDYSVPFENNKKVFAPVQTDNEDPNYLIPRLQTETGSTTQEPGTLDLGPFYFTEGKNFAASSTGGAQSYTLGLVLHDVKEGKDVTLTRELPNLGALFRNTHVILNIDFDESYMHIYGEVGSWTIHPTIYGDLVAQ